MILIYVGSIYQAIYSDSKQSCQTGLSQLVPIKQNIDRLGLYKGKYNKQSHYCSKSLISIKYFVRSQAVIQSWVSLAKKSCLATNYLVVIPEVWKDQSTYFLFGSEMKINFA